MKKTYLIVDVSNFFYKTFFRHIQEAVDMNIQVCHHITLSSINKYFKKYQVDEVVMAFDSYSWRKAYTQDIDTCVTHAKYKGKRRQDMKPADKLKLEKFDEHIPEFVNMIKEKTSIIVLERKFLEADDLIAGWIQAHPDDAHILLSADQDFLQLLVTNNLRIIDPVRDRENTLEEYDNDPEYFMYQKCLRGDAGDNVISSYPRLREKKIKESYTDSLLRTNIMQHTFKVLDNGKDGDPIEHEYLTQDLFEENQLLMDLTMQPPEIRRLIDNTIENAILNRGKFNYLNFLRYCGMYQLDNIRARVDDFIPMLSCGRKKKEP